LSGDAEGSQSDFVGSLLWCLRRGCGLASATVKLGGCGLRVLEEDGGLGLHLLAGAGEERRQLRGQVLLGGYLVAQQLGFGFLSLLLGALGFGLCLLQLALLCVLVLLEPDAGCCRFGSELLDLRLRLGRECVET
jgi:hypothetical protein